MGRRPVSRLSRRRSVSPYPAASKASLRVEVILSCALLFFVGFGVVLFASHRLTLGGVPAPLILSFLGDETARNAYFQKDSQKLHDRLQVMGIEEKIKAFYRPRVRDEAALDQYIHQILYDRTGHVGDAYQVTPQGILTLKNSVPAGFEEWFKLAQEVGLATDSLNQNGIQYVVSFEGAVIPYEELAAIFSLAELQSLRDAGRSLVEAK